MTVYGKCTLPVQISGWQGHVEAIVIDLDAEFDLVLGRNWHKWYNALTHWESMIMEITSEGKQYWLVPYPRRLGSIEGEPEFGCNIISLRGALKVMEPGMEAVLYFIRNAEQESKSVSEANSVPQVLDSRVQSALNEYKEVFMDRLLNKLPPSRDLVHEIDTGDNAPVNIQPYQLAKWATDEQTMQITDLLDK